jgi:dienelactone hydrolase
MNRENLLAHAEQVEIPGITGHLSGDLIIPENASALVIFAHGSGSSRLSPRNQYVASILQEHNLATLLFDLLTPEEEILDSETRVYRFDIDLLTKRLISATDWILRKKSLRKLKLGYFGASTGAASAIRAAVLRPRFVQAVVSRGGRPDLAGDALSQLQVPTLMIVGGLDSRVIQLNAEAFERIPADKKRLEIIPGATHLFEEPGTLDAAAQHAASWFETYLARTS